MVTEDWTEFFFALKRAFPEIKMASLKQWPDLRRQEAEALLREFQRQGIAPKIDPFAPGAERPDLPPIELGDRVSWTIHYVDDTWRNEDIWQIYAWIEPPGWRPRWAVDPNFGSWMILNIPETSFIVQRGSFNPKLPQDSSYKSSDPSKFERRISLGGSSLVGDYYPHQQDKRRWLGQIRRMIMKQTTNVLTYVDLETLAVTARMHKGALDRAGRHAIDWVRAHPRHIFNRNIKAIDWELPPPPWDPGCE
jgi:hypothetical protein